MEVTLSGPPGQAMRTIPGFPNQAGPQPRVAPLGSGRIQQNAKVGNAPGWAFGMQNGGAPGLAAPAARGPNNPSSFAQTIGGSQSSAPLDLSEFPSLSGGAQPQYQTPGQAVWSTQRTAQQTPVGRPQQSSGNPLNSAQTTSANEQAQEHAQQSLDDAFFPANVNGSMDEYRHGGQGGVGQLSGSGQQQPNSADEFPPLGRLGHRDIGGDRRAAIMQNAAGGAFQGSSAVPFGSGHASRIGADFLRQDQNKSGQAFPNGIAHAETLHDEVTNARTGTNPSVADTHSGDVQSVEQPRSPSELPEADRFGLTSLLHDIRAQAVSDAGSLAVGHNLNAMGLDVESTEPLHPTFAGPFATVAARPLQPEYTLPQCYTVSNTHPVEDKLNGLSDETLIWIFYNMPRDVLQETAAKELTDRNWRYHKGLGFWLTKDSNVPEPQLIAHEVERGRYIVFNHRTWAREQRELVIRYSDLDDHITNTSQRIMMGQ